MNHLLICQSKLIQLRFLRSLPRKIRLFQVQTRIHTENHFALRFQSATHRIGLLISRRKEMTYSQRIPCLVTSSAAWLKFMSDQTSMQSIVPSYLLQSRCRLSRTCEASFRRTLSRWKAHRSVRQCPLYFPLRATSNWEEITGFRYTWVHH